MRYHAKLLQRKYVPCSDGLFHVCTGCVRNLGHWEKSHPTHRKLYHNVPRTFLVKREKINLE